MVASGGPAYPLPSSAAASYDPKLQRLARVAIWLSDLRTCVALGSGIADRPGISDRPRPGRLPNGCCSLVESSSTRRFGSTTLCERAGRVGARAWAWAWVWGMGMGMGMGMDIS